MTWLCSIPFAVSLFSSCAAPAPLAVGYVEGEYVQAAPLATARIAEVMVRRGDVLRAGQVLARMDTADAQGTLDGAEDAGTTAPPSKGQEWARLYRLSRKG